jgi:hypothetical protein
MFVNYLRWSIARGRGWSWRMLLESDKKSERGRSMPAVLGGAEGMSALHKFTSDYPFKQLWAHGFGGGFSRFRSVRFKEMRSVQIAGDVVVVQARLEVRARRVWALALAPMPFLASTLVLVIVIVGFLAAGSFPREKVTAVVLIGTILGTGLLVTIGLLAFGMIVVDRAGFEVRKILVRVNGQWRIFNGELQGAEESDVMWLREP